MSVETRLTAADWDTWYLTGKPRLISQYENEKFRRWVHPKRGGFAVDIGCGTGQWTRQLVAWGMDVIGYDYSKTAIKQARRASSHHRLRYALWDVNSEPIPSDLVPGSVDLVTCRLSLAYVDASRLLVDVGRWLAPGGTFYALTPVKTETTAADPYRRGLTEKEIETFADTGWQHSQVRPLGQRHRAIVLRGYGGDRAPHTAAIEVTGE